MNKDRILAYQKEKVELLSNEQKEKLGNQSIKSIKSWTDSSGTTTIIIKTEKYLVVLEATDLGAWLKELKIKK